MQVKVALSEEDFRIFESCLADLSDLKPRLFFLRAEHPKAEASPNLLIAIKFESPRTVQLKAYNESGLPMWVARKPLDDNTIWLAPKENPYWDDKLMKPLVFFLNNQNLKEGLKKGTEVAISQSGERVYTMTKDEANIAQLYCKKTGEKWQLIKGKITSAEKPEDDTLIPTNESGLRLQWTVDDARFSLEEKRAI